MHIKGVVFLAALTLVASGCAHVPGAETAGADMVIYQNAYFGPLPMPSTMPLGGKPYTITSQGDVRAIEDALRYPDRKGVSRMARNNRLAIVHKDGEVVIYGITGADGINPCDITIDQSSRKLSIALHAALAGARVLTFMPTSHVQSIFYRERKFGASAVARSQSFLQELFRCYSPLALKGNRLCKTQEVESHTQRAQDSIIVNLAKPDSLKAIVGTSSIEWPPRYYDTSARLARIEFDTVTIFHERSSRVRFLFCDTRTGKCLLTDPVSSRRLLKKAIGRNPPVYGPDLFEKVVSTLTKP